MRKSPIGRIVYRTDSESSFSVKSAWRRLEKWAAVHLPRSLDFLNPPSSSEELDKLENAIGTSLPKDVRDFYLLRNGQHGGPGVIFGLPIESLAQVVNHWQNWTKGYGENVMDGSAPSLDEVCRSFPCDFVRHVYFDPGWIPLTYDSGGNHIGVDLNPGPNGKRGQVIIFGRDDELHCVLALSWGQFLTDLADELDQGNFSLDNSDPEYPEFNVKVPRSKHFHQIGMAWSRGKLGLKRLSKDDKTTWDKWHGRLWKA